MHMDDIITTIVSLIVGLIVCCIFGAITKSINESKGYDGGFAWGFWLGWIGIIVVACRQPVLYVPKESIIVPSNNSRLPSYTISYHTPAADGWQCRCGRYNARYVSSCVCGLKKADAQSPVAVPAPQTSTPAPTAADDSKIIALLKEYKELLDAGVLTQEEFDAKKKSLLDR